MVFKNNVPLSTDLISDSQVDLFNNNQTLDASFGIDHYPFSNNSTSKGFHNKITTPVFIDNPPTGNPPQTVANIPVMYGFQQTAPLGVLQYSRGPSNAVPSPVTTLQSQAGAITLGTNATTDVLDFTGIPRALCTLIGGEISAPGGLVYTYITWNGSVFKIVPLSPVPSTISAQAPANILQLKNIGAPASSVFWTLLMHRLQ